MLFLFPFIQQNIQTTPTKKQGITQNDGAKKAAKSSEHPSPVSPDRSGVTYTIESDTGSKDEGASSYNPQKDSLYRLYLWATILSALTNILVVVFLIRSANAAKKSADIAEKALRLTQVAELVIDQAGIIAPGGRVGIEPHGQMTIVIKNFGNTKATDVDIRIGFWIDDAEKIPPAEIPRSVIASHQTKTVKFLPMGKMFEPQVLTKLGNGDSKLQFKGTITYKNVFENVIVVECSGTYLSPTRTFMLD